MESSRVHLLFEGKIPNRKWCRRGKKRSGAGQGVLLGRVSFKGEPYVDDQGRERRESRSFGDSGVGRQRNNKDDQDRDDFEPRDEVGTSPVP